MTQRVRGADVVVVGGGIVGVCAALALARRHLSVALCEKGEVAGEQSGSSMGWIRQSRRDLRELPLMIESLKIWECLAKQHTSIGFRRSGTLFVAESDDEMGEFESWSKLARGFGVESHLIPSVGVAALLPGLRHGWTAGLHCPGDAQAEPGRATVAIADAAIQSGATILCGCAVRALETRGGRIAGVVTEKGSIACQAAIIAAGAWTRRLLRDVGIEFPQLKLRVSLARLPALAGAPDIPFMGNKFAFSRRGDGSFLIANARSKIFPVVPDAFRFFRRFLPTIRAEWRSLRPRLDSRFLEEWRDELSVAADQRSPYEKSRALEPTPDSAVLRAASKHLTHHFPVFYGIRPIEAWARMIDVTPDAVPIISNVESIRGLVIASGFSGHGFGIGPGAGTLAADLASATPPIVDPSDFSLSRIIGTRPLDLSPTL